MNEDKTCEDCIFFVPEKIEDESMGYLFGMCRRYPIWKQRAKFQGWCGEFKDKSADSRDDAVCPCCGCPIDVENL
jgi:hypothetical protein